MYGKPKTHKANIPMRPILSMIGSPYHKVAQWLNDMLSPVKESLNKHILKGTDELIGHLRGVNVNSKHIFSIDVESLFTNVPLHETVTFLCDHIEKNSINMPIPIEFLKPLLLICTDSINFQFEDTNYRQVDGVAMGSPLGPLLADIFMAQMEEKLKYEITTMSYYRRYVDDTLLICDNQTQAMGLVDAFNNTHPHLRVTVEHESNGHLSFLDVNLKRRSDGTIETSVYRKPTWNGQYTHYLSFAPIQHKRSLIRTLFSRAYKICSPETLQKELTLLEDTLTMNGYPLNFIRYHGKPPKQTTTQHTAEKKRVILCLPYRGDSILRQMTQQLSHAISRTFYAAKFELISKCTPLPKPPLKPKRSISATSHCLYKFTCSCNSSYLGRTDRALAHRMAEHVPRWIRELANANDALAASIQAKHAVPASSIGKHIVDTKHSVDLSKAFQIVYRCTHARTLKFAEA